jgi:hypothetical protein
VESWGASGEMTAKIATKPDYRPRDPENTGTEYLHREDWEEEDDRLLGFSNRPSRCRCLRGYCEGRDKDCIKDPGIAEVLFKALQKKQREEPR